jgi:ubiquitin-protein ligase E3 C
VQTNKFFTENYNAKEPCDRKVVAVGAVSAFLYVIFNTFPSERIYLELEVAYKSDFIPELWEFMKQCHEGGKLSSLSDGATVWLLPLAVFCSVYK